MVGHSAASNSACCYDEWMPATGVGGVLWVVLHHRLGAGGGGPPPPPWGRSRWWGDRGTHEWCMIYIFVFVLYRLVSPFCVPRSCIGLRIHVFVYVNIRMA
jgi:hypothetical protein